MNLANLGCDGIVLFSRKEKRGIKWQLEELQEDLLFMQKQLEEI